MAIIGTGWTYSVDEDAEVISLEAPTSKVHFCHLSVVWL